jgi:Protein of unknown function (DUF3237)
VDAPEPGLQQRFTLHLLLGAAATVGELSTGGVRRILPVLGGSIQGQCLNGKILPALSGEVHLARASGTTVIEAKYVFEDGSGSVVRLVGQGYATSTPDFAGTRMTMMFETDGTGALAWLATRVFLAERPQGSDRFAVAMVV